MRRSGWNAGSSSGFTLLEVVLATAVLASAAATIMVTHIHSVRQAAAARDLFLATSVARNALEEGIAGRIPSSITAELPAREALTVRYEMKPAGEELLGDTLTAKIEEKATSLTIVELRTKRAAYVQEAEEPEIEGENE